MPARKDDLPVLAFASLDEWHAWLGSHPKTSKGLWLKLAKVGSRTASITKQQAIDGALCHGWIDGQLKAYDDEHWLVRFTPRRPASRWSQVNRALNGAAILRPPGAIDPEARSALLMSYARA
jgi:uncharacterized protein YdeI (YjbR/CyaY-like superfamily)